MTTAMKHVAAISAALLFSATFADSLRSGSTAANAFSSAKGEAGGSLKAVVAALKDDDFDTLQERSAALDKVYAAISGGLEGAGEGDAAACRDYLYEVAAGIQKGFDGTWDEVELAPQPDKRLVFVEAERTIPKGTVKSSWKYERGVCRWRFYIPDGVKATVCVNGTCQRYESGEHELEIEK